ncbi:hypothetical protein AZI87_17105 [Bdellovibrio bacteriovorus]|uniref:Uncharacterized protein n=1 Tax=Bdellovibrio bacteriovorus TaxID=959 RepID=A0A162G0R7_BDEBC|nr:hypothetical protein [Bdellovibrio bacteriovorus]KYG62979.1 hypothetical protein AZI87_17105 [Bdellovibrio bacteriovorus]
MIEKKVKESEVGFSAWELVIVVAIIGVLLMIAGPNFVKFQRSLKMSEEKTQLAAAYTAMQIQKLEKDPTKANEILNQMSSKYPDFRVPAILPDADPKQSASDVKIGILEYRIGKLEETIKDASSSQPSWWILLLVIPGISAMMGRLLNPLFDYLGAHLKSKAQETLEKK